VFLHVCPHRRNTLALVEKTLHVGFIIANAPPQLVPSGADLRAAPLPQCSFRNSKKLGKLRGPIDQKTTSKIEGFRRILGDPIYGEILWRMAHERRADAIPNTQLQIDVVDAMERAARGIHKAHSLAEEIGDTSFISVLDRLQIRSMTTIRNLEVLRQLDGELENLAGRQVA